MKVSFIQIVFKIGSLTVFAVVKQIMDTTEIVFINKCSLYFINPMCVTDK